MALSNTVVKQTYSGNGSRTTFAIPFAVIEDDSAETKVYIRDESDADNITETLQIEGALQDYYLTGASPPGTPFATDVELNTAPTANQKVIIIRELTLTHDLDLSTGNTINREGLEDKIDRAFACIQQLNEVLSRVVRLPITEQFSGDPTVPLAGGYAGKVLGFNSLGTAVQMYSASDLSAAASGGFGSSNSQAILDSQTNKNINNMTVDRATYKAAVVHFAVERSTNVFASGFLFLQDVNGTWRIKESLFSGEEHGLTWGVTEASGVAQVNYDSNTLGSGNIYWTMMKLEA